MTRRILKVLGKRGRITIPYEIRMKNKIRYNDILSFEIRDSNTIIIRKEKLCHGFRSDCLDESDGGADIADF